VKKFLISLIFVLVLFLFFGGCDDGSTLCHETGCSNDKICHQGTGKCINPYDYYWDVTVGSARVTDYKPGGGFWDDENDPPDLFAVFSINSGSLIVTEVEESDDAAFNYAVWSVSERFKPDPNDIYEFCLYDKDTSSNTEIVCKKYSGLSFFDLTSIGYDYNEDGGYIGIKVGFDFDISPVGVYD